MKQIFVCIKFCLCKLCFFSQTDTAVFNDTKRFQSALKTEYADPIIHH